MESPYTPLDPELREIRILALLPGLWTDPVGCNLSIISLNKSHSPYETLSYVWEGADGFENVTLNGKPHVVTKNLFLALRRLRKQDEVRTMWADALCINQEDDEEKSHQVMLMREVYQSCKRVYLWLGEYIDPESNGGSLRKAFQFIDELILGKHLNETSCYQEGSSTEVFDPTMIMALRGLVSSSWFDRLWVIQEAILPPQAIFMLGEKSIPLESLEVATKKLRPHINSCCKHIRAKFYSREKRVLSYFTTEIGDALSMIRDFTGKPVEFSYLMWRNRYRKVSNPRDKVYGLLGLSQTVSERIHPDYTLDVAEVYKQITLHCLNQEKNLRILKGTTSKNEQWPSWVYDWSRPEVLEYSISNEDIYRLFVTYYTSGAVEASSIANQGHLLSLEGIKIDRVIWIGEICKPRPSIHDLAQIVQQWQDYCEGFYQDTRHASRYSNSWVYEFTTILIAGLSRTEGSTEYTITEFEELQTLERWRKIMEQGSAKQIYQIEDLDVFLNLVFYSISGRSLFLTESGYMGLGLPQIGDEVWVLLGGDTPFLLRPDYESSYFSLIGPCFIQGLMSGEAMADLDKKTTVTLK